MYMYDVHTYYHTFLYNKPPFIIMPLLTTFVCTYVCDTNKFVVQICIVSFHTNRYKIVTIDPKKKKKTFQNSPFMVE